MGVSRVCERGGRPEPEVCVSESTWVCLVCVQKTVGVSSVSVEDRERTCVRLSSACEC